MPHDDSFPPIFIEELVPALEARQGWRFGIRQSLDAFRVLRSYLTDSQTRMQSRLSREK